MAARRQDAWEVQLKEEAFLSATIKPIVDDTATPPPSNRPPIPYAPREVKRSMDQGIHFKDNRGGWRSRNKRRDKAEMKLR